MTMINGIKGFDRNLQCRGFQFEVGQTYTHDGQVAACKSGFHAVPDDVHPLAVFDFYPPAGARFCLVEVGGKTEREDTKIAAEILTVVREIGLTDLAVEAVKWVMARSTPEGESAASATGVQGAASATGYQGAASATGDWGAASAGHATSCAFAAGYMGTASGVTGSAICAVERSDDGAILSIASGIVGRDGIKPGVAYRCQGGKLVEAWE